MQDDPNATLCEDGDIPLLEAAMCGSERAMHVILIHGASVTATDALGSATLHWAAITGNTYCAHLLLQYGIPMDNLSSSHFTPFMCAVYFGNINVVRYLIWRGASTTPKLNHRNESALTFASLMGNVAILELILTVVVPLEYRRKELYASLAQAAFGKHTTEVQILLAHGAPVNLPGSSIENSPHAAVYGGEESIVRLLLSRGADVEAVDQHGCTPFVVATRRRNVNMVRALIAAGE
ncbi:Ankyrin repeat and KH domain-containing protein mask [Echinococcus granulosus]|uniref:Ankyrin repeat and KH domain-containing protein mask n=1 Tax=Echinococcus granulosus TaxID=6210 RepID=W6TZW4_ECHGR|nr:Ankyrin repeat and KH domain-containing protein mask [Echinococcus granulosus]EUB54375.1 Ankyrin repeat and KH domain-containing protein mask [Echinococcus granulosus]